jgi:tetratricopeptide (TPR) repeat protein
MPRTAWRSHHVVLVWFLLVGTVSAQVGVAERLIDEGRFEEALAAYDRAVTERPGDARAHLRMARAAVYAADALPAGADAEKQRLFSLAAERAERAVALAPTDPDAHFEVARALGRLAQYRGILASLNLAGRVLTALERALELDANHAASWHALGLFHHEVPWIAGGRSGRVVPSFLRAIALEPDVLSHRVAFAEVLIDRQDPGGAAEHLDHAVRLTPRTYHDRQDAQRARELRASLP